MITSVKIKKRCGHTVTQIFIGSGFQLPVWERLEADKECNQCKPLSNPEVFLMIGIGCLIVTVLYFFGLV